MYTISVQNKRGTTYYYASLKDESIYNVEFRLYKDETGACTNAHSTIIESLELD